VIDTVVTDVNLSRPAAGVTQPSVRGVETSPLVRATISLVCCAEWMARSSVVPRCGVALVVRLTMHRLVVCCWFGSAAASVEVVHRS
jgi:hypothetical protein